MRTSAPDFPSGRSPASTCQMLPSRVTAEQAFIIPVASRVAVRSAASSSGTEPSPGSRASATNTTSTSET